MSGSEKEKDKEDIAIRPKPGVGDYAITIAKAGISGIPIIGGSAAEVFAAIVTPPLVKRRDKWIESIGEKLKQLEEIVASFQIENLSRNDAFITIVTHATQIALRNHQTEKIEALQNAVLNSALSIPIEEDLQLMFLNFVDSFTPWHLRILKYFDNPEELLRLRGNTSRNIFMGGPATYLEIAFPELKENRDFYDQVANDLSNRGLMIKNGNSLHVTMSKPGMLSSRTTAMGKKFLQFISFPIESLKHQ